MTLWNMGDVLERMNRLEEAKWFCSSPQAAQAQESLEQVRGKRSNG
jgi:hypothetical protein